MTTESMTDILLDFLNSLSNHSIANGSIDGNVVIISKEIYDRLSFEASQKSSQNPHFIPREQGVYYPITFADRITIKRE